jgi:hypothetical protein
MTAGFGRHRLLSDQFLDFSFGYAPEAAIFLLPKPMQVFFLVTSLKPPSHGLVRFAFRSVQNAMAAGCKQF